MTSTEMIFLDTILNYKIYWRESWKFFIFNTFIIKKFETNNLKAKQLLELIQKHDFMV